MAACSSSSSFDHGKVTRAYEFSQPDHVITQTITISPSVQFSNPAEQENLLELARRTAQVVCQIQTPNPNQRGSGFLIGGTLLITNHHVLPDYATAAAEESRACFFQVVHQDILKEETCVNIFRIRLDPASCFITNKDLDFTVVALTLHPHLCTVQDEVLSIFNSATPEEGKLICVLQYPDFIDSTTGLRGDFKYSIGSIKQLDLVDPDKVHYDAATFRGSSGGAVINNQGKPIALHSSQTQRQGGIHVKYNSGILLSRIAAALTDDMETINRCLKAPLPPPSVTSKIINLPTSNTAFTGREKELERLHELCSTGEPDQVRRVAVVGLGGMGKTTLVTKYANDHKTEYSLICRIESSTAPEIERDLLNLADELKIPEVAIERRLLLLKTHLEQKLDHTLLIFDGVDDDDVLTYLNKNLPQRGGVTVLLSSRLKDSTQELHFTDIRLQGFTVEEAVEYLLKSIDGKEADAKQAALLASELGYLPLALGHAAAFIHRNRGYSFQRYLDGLIKNGLKAFDPKYNRNEQTILTTWRKNIETIKKLCKTSLPEEILQFISILGNAPIPIDILQKQFSTADELDFLLALQELRNYSLLENSPNSCFIHPLLQKVIRYQLSGGPSPHYFQAFRVFYELSKDWDPGNHDVRRRLDLYIPHIETLLEKTEGSTDVDWRQVNQQFELLWNYYQAEGRYNDSKRIAEMYVEQSRKREESVLMIAKGLFFLGASLLELGDYPTALAQHSEALVIRKKYLTEDDPELIKSYLNIGETLYYLGKNQESLEHYQHVQAASIKIDGEGKDAVTAQKYFAFGIYLAHSNQYQEALKHFQKALEIQKEVLGKMHSTTAKTYRSMGITLHNLGKNEEALIHHQHALEIHKINFGEDHPITATSYCSVGAALRCLGRYDEALTHQQHALKIRKINFGEDHLITATSYQNVGSTLLLLNKYEEALTPLQRALEIRRQMLDDNHPRTAESYHYVGAAFRSLGRHHEALTYLQEALNIRKLIDDKHKDTADSYYQMGRSLNLIGKHEEAVNCLQCALEIRTKLFGENSVQTANIYYDLGLTLNADEKYDQALVYAQKALEIHTQVLGSEHSITSESYNSVQIILRMINAHSPVVDL